MNNTRFNIINEIDTPPYYMNHVTHNESRNSPTEKDVVEALEFLRFLLKEYDTYIQEKLYKESTNIDG